MNLTKTTLKCWKFQINSRDMNKYIQYYYFNTLLICKLDSRLIHAVLTNTIAKKMEFIN